MLGGEGERGVWLHSPAEAQQGEGHHHPQVQQVGGKFWCQELCAPTSCVTNSSWGGEEEEEEEEDEQEEAGVSSFLPGAPGERKGLAPEQAHASARSCCATLTCK